MKGIKKKIEEIEDKFLRVLCAEVEKEFRNTWLPSHDAEHHKRVWSFSKDLLLNYDRNGCQFSDEFIEALMFAAFFHDVGLTKTLDVKHGTESAKIAQRFINTLPFWNNSRSEEMIEAIVMHDDKMYLNSDKCVETPSLYSILTVSDDLDAFGAIGVYRYLEIYCLRGTAMDKIREAIQNNMQQRYRFVSKILSFDKILREKQFVRYSKAENILEYLKEEDIHCLISQIHQKVDIHNVKGGVNVENTSIKAFLQDIKQELGQHKAI